MKWLWDYYFGLAGVFLGLGVFHVIEAATGFALSHHMVGANLLIPAIKDLMPVISGRASVERVSDGGR